MASVVCSVVMMMDVEGSLCSCLSIRRFVLSVVCGIVLMYCLLKAVAICA